MLILASSFTIRRQSSIISKSEPSVELLAICGLGNASAPLHLSTGKISHTSQISKKKELTPLVVSLLSSKITSCVLCAPTLDLRSQNETAYWANVNLNLEKKVKNVGSYPISSFQTGPAYSIPA